ISEANSVHVGQKFWIVLHIKLQPGWHTYWKNPGDSGMPPQLTWTLPNGFVASGIRFLAPDREAVGPLVDYAYSDNAYYLTSVTPPPILHPGMAAIFAVKARWLVCKDICVPESGDLSIALPTAQKPEVEGSNDSALVADLVNRLPIPSSHTFGYS